METTWTAQLTQEFLDEDLAYREGGEAVVMRNCAFVRAVNAVLPEGEVCALSSAGEGNIFRPLDVQEFLRANEYPISVGSLQLDEEAVLAVSQLDDRMPVDPMEFTFTLRYHER